MNTMKPRVPWIAGAIATGVVLLLAGMLWLGKSSRVVRADSSPPEVMSAPLTAGEADPGVSNAYCLECHAKPGQIKEMPSGEQLYLTIDPEAFQTSVHGEGGYACAQCHVDIRSYPESVKYHGPTKSMTCAA